ncbi:MAG TPA: DUF6512 family protein [Saprospiraceae bacterium]|nr:DUF6512 family protein [Saprospiraceae bacterium]
MPPARLPVLHKIKTWLVCGVFLLILLGSCFHFAYAWSGESKWLAVIAPVNESVWEHLKMGYWALFLYSIPEYWSLGKFVSNYFLAKTLGVLALELTILTVFYGYTFITGHSILWLDIASYILGCLICQWIAWTLFRKHPLPKYFKHLAWVVFTGLGIGFGVLSLHPPKLGIFKDQKSSRFGIEQPENAK